MPEPLPIATELTEIGPGIFRWSAHSPHHQVELTAHAVATAGGWLIFDPIPLAPEPETRLKQFPGRSALALTNGNHERAAIRWSHALAAPIWTPPGAFAEPLNAAAAGGATLFPFPGWQILPLPGGAPGETAFFHPDQSLMVFGDAVVNLPGRTLEVLPDRYCVAPARLRDSLKTLPRFERALFAHGQPLLSAASDRIAALL
jgi:glyoxylase-like metal-dependent hydrolase (beta-lactamase superfamily II)